MYRVPTIRLAFFMLCCIVLLSACNGRDTTVQLEGMQGTALWHVTLPELPAGVTVEEIRQGVVNAFADSSDMIATWREDSEISRFNQYQNTDWFTVSPELAELVGIALQLGQQSEGAYDVTIGPLIRLWGFSAEGIRNAIPAPAEVDAARAVTGYQKLEVRTQPPALRKAAAELQVELASLADGFAADQAGIYLESLGIQHYMVEIAGEIRTRGLSPRGDSWRVAIEKPQETGRSAQIAIRLEDSGLATSGDYRNYFVQGGKRYSHTLDPATGYPVTHSLASVSVLAPRAAVADAYATLLMAMGEERGIELAERENIAAYFIWRTEQGFATHATATFQDIFPIN